MAILSVARIQDKAAKHSFVSATEEKINFVYKNSLLIVGRGKEINVDRFV